MSAKHPEVTDALPPYPGRCITVGSLPSGDAFWLYFVTGRSASSLERRVATRADGTTSICPREVGSVDDLRHYVAARPITGGWLVGNGTQVEGVGDVDLKSLPSAFSQWEFEPDAPIWTPRIIAAISSGSSPDIVICAARRDPAGKTDHLSMTGSPEPGTGVRMHTYTGPVADPRPDGVPQWVIGVRSLAETADRVWKALAPDRRVLLVARNLADGETILRERTPSQ